MGHREHHHFSAGRLQRYLLRKALLHRMSKRARDDAAGASGDAPIGGDKTDIALSVDETNKLRADLGLKPLDEAKTDEAKENWLKEEAQLKADMFDEADEEAAYEASDLSGLKVAHQTSELKDGSILEGTGDQINLKKYEDELENVNLKDMQTAKRNAKRKVYSAGDRGHNPFDDHEFNEDGSINTNKRKILEKYDDDAERNREALLEDKQKIVITETGAAVAAKSLIEDEVGEEDQEAARMKQKISQTLQVKFQAIKEQYTEDEVAAFKKPGDKKMRKKKKMRTKTETIEWDVQPESGQISKDHGSRDSSTKAKAEALSIQAKLAAKQSSYTKALSKAYENSQKLVDGDDECEEEYDELSTALERARRLELAKKSQKTDLKDFMVKPKDKKDAADDALVLTGTIEFCRGITQDEAPKQAAVAVDESEPTQEEADEEMQVAEDKDEDSDDDDDGNFVGERNLGRGLGGALEMIRNRGSLKDSVEMVLGRNEDEKSLQVNDADDRVALDAEGKKLSKFRLEYRDKFGRLLSQKEAFRQLSYGFHGKGPGKSKIEARQRKIAEQQRVKKTAQAGTTPMSLVALEITQKKSRQAHMVIGGAGRMDL